MYSFRIIGFLLTFRRKGAIINHGKHLEIFMKTNFAIKDYSLILLGSLLYALSTILFIFPMGLSLGGTSGISVILTNILPFSPGIILSVINMLLIVRAVTHTLKHIAFNQFVIISVHIIHLYNMYI